MDLGKRKIETTRAELQEQFSCGPNGIKKSKLQESARDNGFSIISTTDLPEHETVPFTNISTVAKRYADREP